jgi:predicted transcriptional regulator
MKPKRKTVRIQLVLSQESNSLLDTLAEKELRTRSSIVELAILAYDERKTRLT